MKKGFYAVTCDREMSFENSMLDAFLLLRNALQENEEGTIYFYKFLNRYETEWELVFEKRYFKKKGNLVKFYDYYVHS